MTYIFSIKSSVIPLRDLIAPPLTSKLLKHCMESRIPRRKFNSHGNVTYTQLSDGSKPLYSVGEFPIALRSGFRYSGRVVVVSEDHGFLSQVDPEIRCSGAYGDYVVSVEEIEVYEMKSLTMELSNLFKIAFVTPTILSVKLMTPPSLRGKTRRFPELHKLIPQPSFMFSYLLKLWNSYASPEERIPKPPYNEWAHYKLGRLADITLAEIDYRVRPETAIIGRNENGTLRKARGFVGWVIYESVAPRSLHNIYAKLLKLASLTGVGRSRGLGLGQIKITNLTRHQEATAKAGDLTEERKE
ncbi:MAG: CRISPR system precrRNA processing endoribonuclease RAMP protein Cas6 [Zestosphaera sp.]